MILVPNSYGASFMESNDCRQTEAAMILVPNSWGTETRERWSDAARQRSIEVRRAKAAARKKFAEEYGTKYPSPRTTLAATIDADTQRTYNAHGTQVSAGPWAGKSHADFGVTNALLSDGPPKLSTTHGPPKIVLNTDSDFPDRPHSRGDVLSVLRHEIGHLDVGWSARGRPYKIAGKNVSHRYAQEFAAWKAAVRDAPHNRVRWSVVKRALTSYRRQDMKGEPEARVQQAVDRDIAVLKRYGRRLRRHDTTPEGV